MSTKTGMQRVFENVTHEQAMLLWELLSGYVEDSEVHGVPTCAGDDLPYPHAVVAAELVARLDAEQVKLAEAVR